MNNKKYIGFTRYPESRWSAHLSMAKKYVVGQAAPRFYKAMAKIGIHKFEFIVLSNFVTKEECREAEIDLIKSSNSKWPYGYNVNK